MAHDPAWHAEYASLDLAKDLASAAFHKAQRALERKATAQRQAAYDAALEALRAAGKARWDFEMAATTVVDIATLPTGQFWAAMRSR